MPRLHTAYMVKSICFRLLVIEPKILHANRAASQVPREIIEVATSQPFLLLLANLLEKRIFIKNLTLIALTVDGTQIVAPTKTSLLEFDRAQLPRCIRTVGWPWEIDVVPDGSNAICRWQAQAQLDRWNPAIRRMLASANSFKKFSPNFSPCGTDT